MKKPCVKSYALSALRFGWVIFLSASAEAQVMQDSTGHIPALRTHITPPSNAPTWWERFGEQHLLDFSEEQNKVVVDPIVQVMAGTVQFEDDGQEDLIIWDNIRGARFQAELDERFHIGGELLERQGVADPLLGLWAVQQRIPGWGRSKLGRNNGWNNSEQAYYDASRVRGWTGWSNGFWSMDTGIDAMHFGAGRASALISKTAAPAPYARIGFEQKQNRTEVSISQWMSHERGPLGETAESLLNRSHVLTVQHIREIKPRWLVQSAYQFVREKGASIASAGWEALGYHEGESYHAKRHVIGIENQIHFRFLRKGKGLFYLQQSIGFGGQSRRVNGTLDPYRSIHPLTSLAGIHLKTNRLELRAEAYQKSAAVCSTCFDFEQLIPSIEGPRLASLQQAGIDVQGIWNESLRIEGTFELFPRWRVAMRAEQNNAASWGQLQTSYTIHPTWPLELYGTIGIAEARNQLVSNYRWLSIGINAAVSNGM
jgi:hypothetical protein